MTIELDGAASAASRAILPKFVELQHRTEGWVRVDLEGPADGVVALATADLPPGRYEAVRFVYLVDGGLHGWVPAEALLLQAFCLGPADPLATVLLHVGPGAGDTIPTRVSVEAPACVEDRAAQW